MGNNNKKTLLIVTLIAVFTAGLSVAAYIGAKNVAKGYSTKKAISKSHFPAISDGPVKLKTDLNNQYYYDNENVYLYIDISSENRDSYRKRSPLNIGVVIDRSGSMADRNKLSYVKRSVEHLIDQMERDDYISIVMYDDYVDVLQDATRIRDRQGLKDKISRIQPGGFTNLSDGMFEGYEQVERKYSRGYVNRVLLLSDGLANRGITDRFRLADMVRDRNRRDGITISTFGVGNDFNEDLMADIADYGKGNYYYIRDSEEIPRIFAQELRDVKYLVGQSAKVKVRFPKDYLQVNNVFGYPYDVENNEIIIDFKDLFAGQNRSILIKFDITRRITQRLSFTSELTYEDVYDSFRKITETNNNDIRPADSKAQYDKGMNENVQQNVAVFESNYIMEQALREADQGNYEMARTKVKESKDYLDAQMNTVGPSPEMTKQKENLNRYDAALESAETKTEEEKKEMQKSGKFDNYNMEKKKNE